MSPEEDNQQFPKELCGAVCCDNGKSPNKCN